MDLEAITPKFLDAYLHAFRHSAPKSPELLNLHSIVFPAGASSEEKHWQIFEWLETCTLENLASQRAAQDPAGGYQAAGWQQAIRLDFQNTNTILQSWSALYHRFFARETGSFEDLAETAGADPRQFRRRLNSGLEELCAIIQRAEMDAHHRQQRASLGTSIPSPDYQQLFGTQLSCARICDWLIAPDGPRMLSLEGMGGIGKTSLAQAVTEQLLGSGRHPFRDILWVSVRQELLTLGGEIEKVKRASHSLDDIATDLAQALGLTGLAGLGTSEKTVGLQSVLSQHPYLVIVDNLETLQEVRLLLPLLGKIGGPSRFLFTSRKSLGSFPYVQVFGVPELSFADSCKLIESEVGRRRQKFKLSRESAERILAVVGGLPLALKLVAAQICEFSEEHVLERIGAFEPGRSQTALYTYIYKSSWAQLDDPARQLLLSMLMISQNGDSLGWIRTQSGLPEDQFEAAFSRLLDLSLVETHSIQGGGHYSLHRLTQSFLKSNILRGWSG